MKGSLVTAILAVFYTCLTAEANAIYAATSSRTTGAGASTNSYYAAGADLDSCFFNTIASGHSTGTGYIPGSSHGSGTGRGANIPEAAAIRAAIDSIASEYGIPSVAFAVVNRDSIIVADAVGLAAGYEDPERGIAATPGTVYRIGSVTKTFVALGIMHLVHEGKLDLDDPLSVIVPELPVRNRWEESHPVLLRHLLEHTAGFRDLYLRDFMIPEGTPLPAMEDAVMRQPRYWVSRWWPGTRSAYANPGYTLLGYIIEKYSGMPYNEYLEEILLHPLGMENSDFLGRNSDSLALSYDSSGNPQAPLPIMDHPAGYLHTTPEDMARFIHFMLLRGAAGRVGDGTGVANQPGAGSGATDQPVDSPDGTGQERGTVPDEREGDPSWQSGSEYGRPWFMPEEMFRLMERPSSIAGAGNEMLGYGMGLHSMVVNGNVGAGHDGGIDEYLSSFVSFHVAGSAYYFTITSMNPQGASAIAGYLQEILLDEITPVSDNIADQPAEIEGWYRIRSYRLALARILHDLFDPVKLQVVNDTLRMGGFSGQTTNLISLGGGYYRTEDSPLPTHWIGLHGGRPVISSSFGQSGGYYEQTNAFRALGKTWALLISFNLFFLTALIYFVNYLVVRFRKRDINSAPMVWPALGVLCLVLMVFVFSGMTSIYLLASPNTRSVAVAIFSALFAICLVMGLLSLRRGVTHVKTWKRVPLYAGYVAWIYIVVLLASYGHMPLTTWIW